MRRVICWSRGDSHGIPACHGMFRGPYIGVNVHRVWSVYDFERTGQPNTGLLPDLGVYPAERDRLIEPRRPLPFAPDLAVEVAGSSQKRGTWMPRHGTIPGSRDAVGVGGPA